MRIQFQNIACCEWVHLLPSITFHIKGWREGIGIFRSLFPKDKKGFQVLIHWLWFEILIETEEKKIYFMENKINIAELLKDCPKGMELDCAMWDNCTFDGIEDVGYINILVKTPTGQIKLSKEGCFVHNCDSAKCVIFPKGKTTWEGFHRPFTDGDILATNDGKFIAIIKKNGGKYHCCCHINGNYFVTDYSGWFDRFATEEEKARLFQVIKNNGYRWNAETKTLEKLIEPKFKVGDKVRHKAYPAFIYTITNITKDKYECGKSFVFKFTNQNEYELVPNKFDISTLVPFESKVLIRNVENQRWLPAFWGYKVVDGFITTFGWSKYCIPYKGNENLFKTNNDCDDFYKTWEE